MPPESDPREAIADGYRLRLRVTPEPGGSTSVTVLVTFADLRGGDLQTEVGPTATVLARGRSILVRRLGSGN